MLHTLSLAGLCGVAKGTWASLSGLAPFGEIPPTTTVHSPPTEYGIEFASQAVKNSANVNSLVSVGQLCIQTKVTNNWPGGQSVDNLLQVAGYAPEQLPSEFNQAFTSKRRRDFETSRVDIVDGWVLARAEVAICIIFALHMEKVLRGNVHAD